MVKVKECSNMHLNGVSTGFNHPMVKVKAEIAIQ